MLNYVRQDVAPPASDNEIAAVESKFHVVLPAELIDLLRESNGITLWRDPKEVQILSTREMVDYYDCYGFPKWMPEAVPFAMDGNGNFLVLRRNGGHAVHVVSAGNLGWHDAIQISKTFMGFMEDSQPPSEHG